MAIITQLILLFSTLIFTFTTISSQSSLPSCQPDSCNSNHGPSIRFPFRLKNRQPARCGYPGFDLSCNDKNQTILNLPRSGDFIVTDIDYIYSSVFVSDPNSCLASRALNFTLLGSPFGARYPTYFTYLNCTAPPAYGYFVPLRCMSGGGTMMMVFDSWWGARMGRLPPSCVKVSGVRVPLQWHAQMLDRVYHIAELDEDFELGWSAPDCGDCEDRNGVCGFKNESGLEYGCAGASGLRKSTKEIWMVLAALFGAVLALSLLSLGIIYLVYACDKIEDLRSQRRLNSTIPTTVCSYRLPPISDVIVNDLDSPNPNPAMMVSEKRQVTKPSDETICLICWRKFESKDIIKSHPDPKCNHYFHAGCINGILKLKGACPLCTTSLKSSSRASTSLSSSNYLSTTLSSFLVIRMISNSFN